MRLIRRLLSVVYPLDRDLRQEIDSHLAEAAEEYVQRGLSPTEAIAAAQRDFGGVLRVREAHREVRRGAFVNELEKCLHDVRQALRMCSRQPLFSLVVVLVLALGIGLVTMVASFTYSAFLRPWQVSGAQEVVVIRLARNGWSKLPREISIPEFRYLQQRTRTLSDVMMMFRWGAEEAFDADRSLGDLAHLHVSANYLQALQIPMMVGRGFTAGEDDFRAPVSVAVISDVLWRDGFSRDPRVIGREIRLGRRSFAIIGVAAVPGFIDVSGINYDVVVPMATDALAGSNAAARFAGAGQEESTATVAGRLRPGASQAAASTELTALSKEFRREWHIDPANIEVLDTRPISRGTGGNSQWQVTQLVLLALVLVQLLACANVGNMLLARGLARQREMAIRLSIGAGRWRVVRQLVTEAGVLSAVAGLIALIFPLALPSLVRWMDTDRFFQRPEFYGAGAPVFWLALGMSALTAIVCGVAPALRATRFDLASVAAERHGHTQSGTRLRRGLLAVQIALAAVLLTGAGLLTRAIDHVLSVDPGFALNELQTMSVQFPSGIAAPRGRAFFLRLDEALKQSGLPPVAIVDSMPLVDNRAVFPVRDREGQVYLPAARGVSPNYFEVMGIRLIAGRSATDGMMRVEEGTSSFETREIVVSQSVAQHLWPGENPLGKIVQSGFRADELSAHEVVGVVADAASATLAAREPTVYQMGAFFSPSLLVRDLSPAVVGRVRALAATIQPRAVVSSRPLTAVARETLFATIVLSRVAWGIGALALLLALIGAFGVFSYIVEERRREIGIRVALGARGPQVVRFVVGNTQRTVAAGLLLGFGLSAGLVPLLRRFLYGLSPFDPASYLLVAAILGAAAALATWIPARRATRVDPAVTLRSD